MTEIKALKWVKKNTKKEVCIIVHDTSENKELNNMLWILKGDNCVRHDYYPDGKGYYVQLLAGGKQRLREYVSSFWIITAAIGGIVAAITGVIALIRCN